VASVGEAGGPAERHFPVPVVAGHGLLAATTLVLVLLAALNVGGRLTASPWVIAAARRLGPASLK
jgi:hypothetical protein